MSEMESTMKPLIVSLFASFILGGIVVYANDQGQDRAIAEVEEEAADHEGRIRVVEDAQIGVKHDISQIQKDIARIVIAVERIAE